MRKHNKWACENAVLKMIQKNTITTKEVWTGQVFLLSKNSSYCVENIANRLLFSCYFLPACVVFHSNLIKQACSALC